MAQVKIVKKIEIKPSEEFILVKVDTESDEMTAGGIIVPTAALNNKKTQTGVIVTAGAGRRDPQDSTKWFMPVACKAGDRILFACFIGYPIVLGDQGEHVLIKHADIMGFVSEEAEYLNEEDVPAAILRDVHRSVA